MRAFRNALLARSAILYPSVVKMNSPRTNFHFRPEEDQSIWSKRRQGFQPCYHEPLSREPSISWTITFFQVTTYVTKELSTKLCTLHTFSLPVQIIAQWMGSWLEAIRLTTRLPMRVSHCCPLLLACIQSYCLDYI